MTKPLDPLDSGNISLLLLADILDYADARHVEVGERTYDQTRFAHDDDDDCGTPACAIGHWLMHTRGDPRPEDGDLDRLQREFALTRKQWSHLFGYEDPYPRTAKEAAERIRAFVASRSPVTVEAEPK